MGFSRRNKKYGFHHLHLKDPLNILNARLAKGEVTIEEYEKVRQSLTA